MFLDLRCSHQDDLSYDLFGSAHSQKYKLKGLCPVGDLITHKFPDSS